MKMLKSEAVIVTTQMLQIYNLEKMVFENVSNSNSGTFSIFPAFEQKMVNLFYYI